MAYTRLTADNGSSPSSSNQPSVVGVTASSSITAPVKQEEIKGQQASTNVNDDLLATMKLMNEQLSEVHKLNQSLSGQLDEKSEEIARLKKQPEMKLADRKAAESRLEEMLRGRDSRIDRLERLNKELEAKFNESEALKERELTYNLELEGALPERARNTRIPGLTMMGSLAGIGAGIYLAIAASIPVAGWVAILAAAALALTVSTYYFAKNRNHNSFFKAKTMAMTSRAPVPSFLSPRALG